MFKNILHVYNDLFKDKPTVDINVKTYTNGYKLLTNEIMKSLIVKPGYKYNLSFGNMSIGTNFIYENSYISGEDTIILKYKYVSSTGEIIGIGTKEININSLKNTENRYINKNNKKIMELFNKLKKK